MYESSGLIMETKYLVYEPDRIEDMIEEIQERSVVEDFSSDAKGILYGFGNLLSIVNKMVIIADSKLAKKLSDKRFVSEMTKLSKNIDTDMMTKIKFCDICNKPFTQISSLQQYCCKKCRRTAQNRRSYQKVKELKK